MIRLACELAVALAAQMVSIARVLPAARASAMRREIRSSLPGSITVCPPSAEWVYRVMQLIRGRSSTSSVRATNMGWKTPRPVVPKSRGIGPNSSSRTSAFGFILP